MKHGEAAQSSITAIIGARWHIIVTLTRPVCSTCYQKDINMDGCVKSALSGKGSYGNHADNKEQ